MRRQTKRISGFLTLTLSLTLAPAGLATATAPAEEQPSRPIVIAHRGASAERPEHTLAAYELAIEQGADFIEPDLVITRDGALVARHEHVLAMLGPDGKVREATTDVADHPEFASRKTTKRIGGKDQSGWFVEDFTLAELRTLRARERMPAQRPGSARFDGQFTIPTFDEVVKLAKAASARTGRTIGVYPETKHPAYFRSIGLPLEERVAAALKAHDLDRPDAPVFVQTFELDSLKRLRSLTRAPLIMLVSPGKDGKQNPMVSPAGLKDLAQYAQGIGPHKDMLISRDKQGRLAAPTSLVADAHAAGLKVHPWTFRPENAYLPVEFRIGTDPNAPGDLDAELQRFLALGLDGLFADAPGAAARAIRRMHKSGN